jgi:hypothetical protein
MKIIFVHVPKTAGMALQEAIAQSLPTRDVHFKGYNFDSHIYPRRYQILELFIRYRWRHAPHTVRFYQHLWKTVFFASLPLCTFGHINLKRYSIPTPKGWQANHEFTYIGFIREPLNRAISHYYYNIAKAKNEVNNFHLQRFCQEFPTLTDFLISDRYANFQTSYLLFPHQFDFIGITEHMEQSLDILRSKYPFFKTLSNVRVVNQGNKNAHEIASLSEETINIFQSHNVQDYTLYDSVFARYNRIVYF